MSPLLAFLAWTFALVFVLVGIRQAPYPAKWRALVALGACLLAFLLWQETAQRARIRVTDFAVYRQEDWSNLSVSLKNIGQVSAEGTIAWVALPLQRRLDQDLAEMLLPELLEGSLDAGQASGRVESYQVLPDRDMFTSIALFNDVPATIIAADIFYYDWWLFARHSRFCVVASEAGEVRSCSTLNEED